MLLRKSTFWFYAHTATTALQAGGQWRTLSTHQIFWPVLLSTQGLPAYLPSHQYSHFAFIVGAIGLFALHFPARSGGVNSAGILQTWTWHHSRRLPAAFRQGHSLLLFLRKCNSLINAIMHAITRLIAKRRSERWWRICCALLKANTRIAFSKGNLQQIFFNRFARNDVNQVFCSARWSITDSL